MVDVAFTSSFIIEWKNEKKKDDADEIVLKKHYQDKCPKDISLPGIFVSRVKPFDDLYVKEAIFNLNYLVGWDSR